MAKNDQKMTSVPVPDIGDFTDVEIIEVLVSEGDKVSAEDPLITLETDKAAMDVPSPMAGTVHKLKVKTGDKVSEGSVILELTAADGADSSADPDASSGSEAGDAQAASGTAPAAGAATKKKTKEESAASSAPSELEVRVPDIGDFSDVEIIDVLVAEGDEVEAEQGLITLETEKAAMDVPAPSAGKVLGLAVAQGGKVSEGDLVLTLQVSGAGNGEKPERGSSQVATEATTEKASEGSAPAPDSAAASAADDRGGQRGHSDKGGQLPPIDEAGFAKAHASPSVRKFARELGVDLGRVKGSGAKGRVTQDDVKAYVKAALGGDSAGATTLPKVPEIDFTKFGDIERKPLTRIQKISGPRLQASWINLPHVTQHDEADITDLEKLRKAFKARAEEEGVKLTPLAFFVKACVQVLAEFPQFNASLDPDGEHLILKKYFHIGFAADTPNGLVVPVIRDVNDKSIFDVARELSELAGKAREGKLKAAEMQGGCFTVSSLGGIGGTAFTPIINAPEVAILGISRARMAPVWDGKAFQPRLMLPLSLSYDHRVIDGAAAARFTVFLGQILSETRDLVP